MSKTISHPFVTTAEHGKRLVIFLPSVGNLAVSFNGKTLTVASHAGEVFFKKALFVPTHYLDESERIVPFPTSSPRVSLPWVEVAANPTMSIGRARQFCGSEIAFFSPKGRAHLNERLFNIGREFVSHCIEELHSSLWWASPCDRTVVIYETYMRCLPADHGADVGACVYCNVCMFGG